MTQWTETASVLPDDETLVLIALAGGEVYPGFRDRGHWYYASGMPVEPMEVTHWMHMPAPPGAVA